MDDNANPCGEFIKCCWCLNKVGELAKKPTCADFTIWCLVSIHCLVYELNVDIHAIYAALLILLDVSLVPTVAEFCG
jgi:hypothetical protein